MEKVVGQVERSFIVDPISARRMEEHMRECGLSVSLTPDPSKFNLVTVRASGRGDQISRYLEERYVSVPNTRSDKS